MRHRNQIPELALSIRQLWLFVGWMLVLLVIYLSLTPIPMEPLVEQGDKFAHVLAYAVLMSWFANLYEISAQRMTFAAGFIVLGISLEFVQRWTGYRSFEVADMVAGTTGVVAAWVFAPPRIPNYLRMMETVFRI